MNKELQELLVKEFGFNDGMRIGMVVIPNIIADFEKTLLSAVPGVEIKEEYKFDDRAGAIIAYGIRQNSSTVKVCRLEINGKTISI